MFIEVSQIKFYTIHGRYLSAVYIIYIGSAHHKLTMASKILSEYMSTYSLCV